jgi:hypothetical protein
MSPTVPEKLSYSKQNNRINLSINLIKEHKLAEETINILKGSS